MTKHPDLFAALAAPFDQGEVKIRSQNSRQLHYITARTVMNRLDSVLGPENWWDSYPVIGENSVLCQLTIRLPDGSTLTKCDAGGCAGMADPGDDDKSAVSDAFKRAAVKLGVARYLYRDGVPTFTPEATPAADPEPQPPQEPPAASPGTNGHPNGHTKRRDVWGGPKPSQAGPATSTAPPPAPPATGNGQVPATGRALYAWVKEQEQRYNVGLLKYLNGWAKLQDFPGRMIDWNRHETTLAYAEAVRKLAAIESQEVPGGD